MASKNKNILLLLILFSLPSLFTSCSETERNSLLSFISDLSPSSNFSINGSDCCNWNGIECNTFKRVVKISLPSEGLTGKISPSISNLTDLAHLNLSHNSLTGQLPLFLLDKLIVLDVSFNQLNSFLPDQSCHTSSSNSCRSILLRVLNISSNLFSGQLPLIFWELKSNLLEFNASTNNFNGTIPSSLCINSSYSLVSIDLSNNQINGNIPVEISNCTALREFRIGLNILTGKLPDGLFDITSLEHVSLPSNQIEDVLHEKPIEKLINLITLDLGNNRLSGEIPESVGRLNKIEKLLLANNNLSGKLPNALANCTNLVYLNLMQNNFTGELAQFNFSRLKRLEMLDLFKNNFTAGHIPESLYSCESLKALRLSSDNLFGEISPKMSNLNSLNFLSLAVNSFRNITGAFRIFKTFKNLSTLLLTQAFNNETVPDGYEWETGFENIQILSLAACNLTGEIPFWFSKLTKLKFLLLARNQLTGPIPDWLGNLPSLLYLDISGNYLSGNIPFSITNMPFWVSDNLEPVQLKAEYFYLPVYVMIRMRFLYKYTQLPALPPTLSLSNNCLTGTIPISIGQLKKLHVIDLSGNKLTGNIPEQIGNLTNLETLDLSRNNLSGKIPVGLVQLNFLSTFSVANNSLEGNIPSGGQLDTFPDSSFEGNPKLCGSQIKKPCDNKSGKEIQEEHKEGVKNNRWILVVVFSIIMTVCFVLPLIGCYVLFLQAAEVPTTRYHR